MGMISEMPFAVENSGPAWRRLSRRSSLLLAAWLVAVSSWAGEASLSTNAPTKPGAVRGEALNLPPDYLRRVRQRELMDEYAQTFHSLEKEVESGVIPLSPRYQPNPAFLQVLSPELPAGVLQYRLPLTSPLHPVRGYLAPILERSKETPAVTLPADELTPAQREAAEIIQQSLAADGLMFNLARCLEKLGSARYATNATSGLADLWRIGFPVDWLGFFTPPTVKPGNVTEVIAWVAKKLDAGEKAETLKADLQGVPFEFRPANADFRGAEETGEHEIGLVRLQIGGGGYREGIVPGGTLDVPGQLIAALPQADFIITAPEAFLPNVQWLASRMWPLRRPNRAVLISEKTPISAWAQDNGKMGYLAGPPEMVGVPATLAARYASQNEINQLFYPGESFLMDGVSASGHKVFHSPLLFQGGNLMVVHDPQKKRRLLLLSETEVYRNVSLGLTQEQAREAFRREFGVDECVVLPAVSYHLDYDLTVRLIDGKLVAFVNDPEAAASLIVRRAIDAFEQGQLMDATSAGVAKGYLASKDYSALIRRLGTVLSLSKNEEGRYRVSFARLFAAGRLDAPSFNLRCFFAAADILASIGLTGKDAPPDQTSRDYLQGLAELDATARVQHRRLQELGWKVVLVPSMPDLYRSLNYLNGLHDRTRWIMPSVGGFYKDVDAAAAAVFQRELGAGIEIVRVNNTALQQDHGGLHCVAAAFPRIKP